MASRLSFLQSATKFLCAHRPHRTRLQVDMSQTSKFVKKLASNDRATREATFKALSKYLSSRNAAKLDTLEMEKLWKGLYFSMWFCDRPGPQQRLAENLGLLYSGHIPVSAFPRFVEAFWVIMIREWPTIDQWRIDKYYLLIRRVVRHCFRQLKQQNWDSKLVQDYLEALEKHPLSGNQSVGTALPYHLCDIWMDELERVVFEKDDEENEEQDEEQDDEKVLEKLENVPVDTLVEPFAKLSKSAALKTLREKCKTEVLEDKRYQKWLTQNSDEEEEDADEEEWKGF